NLISRLQSTSGFGVRPALYSLIMLSTTPSLYSFSKSRKRKWISSAIAAFIASRLSSRQLQGIHSGCHALMKTPVTSKPRSLRRAAETAESTPPESPTKTFFFLFDVFLLVGDMLVVSAGIVHAAVVTGQEIEIRRGSRV